MGHPGFPLILRKLPGRLLFEAYLYVPKAQGVGYKTSLLEDENTAASRRTGNVSFLFNHPNWQSLLVQLPRSIALKLLSFV